jgi:alkylation response protein AidB-like acyl-CoA dehydrogenase
MDLNFTSEEESFRKEVRTWLEENLPKSGLRGGDNRAHADQSTLEKMKGWHHRLHEAGYLALSWPKEYGGQAMDPCGRRSSMRRWCGHARLDRSAVVSRC